MTPEPDQPEPGISRRGLIFGTGASALGGLALGAGLATTIRPAATAPAPPPPAAGTPVPAAGANQAGIGRPANPQTHHLVVVADLDLVRASATLAALGTQVLRLTDPQTHAELPDGAGDLTIHIGIGPRVLALNPTTAGLADLPLFAGDAALPPTMLGGDLLLAIQATNPAVLETAYEVLSGVGGLTVRWRELGYRGPSEDGITRNPLGYHDGVIIPRGDAELAEQVWISDGPLAGGAICVIRRFVLDTRSFAALTPERQDAVIGRERVSGRPLSGGQLRDQADINARTPDGELIVPLRSHVRAAHPSFTDSGLMLRRGYGFSTTGAVPEHGLLFICYQNAVRTFVATQQRMDEMDDLMGFARPTATASFAILPGYAADRPLGSTLAL